MTRLYIVDTNVAPASRPMTVMPVIADLHTLIDTITARAGIGFDEITNAVASTITQRGAFHQRLVGMLSRRPNAR